MAHRLSFARRQQSSATIGIYFTSSSQGGGSVKTQELILTCRYSDEAQSIAQIIQSSFDSFLKKELQNVEKHPYPIV